MKKVGYLCALTFVLACLCALGALCEPARIETGGGTLNMRQKADGQSTVIERIPNGAQVEAEEADGIWSRIVYKGKSGYVKSEFLRPAVQEDAEDGQSGDAQENAEGGEETALIQQGGFARISTKSGKLNMRRKADAKSAVVELVPNGERVEVEEAAQDWSRITYKGKTGYVKTEFLKLDSQMIGRTVYPDGGYLYIREEPDEKAQSVTSVHAAQSMSVLEMGEQWIRVSSWNPYCGVVQGYVRAEDISKWLEAPSEQTVQACYAYMTLSTQELVLGEALEISVQAEAGAARLYSLYRDEEAVFENLEAAYDTVSYRPRTCGNYRLEVIVRDASGSTVGCEAFFTVSGEAQETEAFTMYSQKDGWWLDKKYGRSNLDQSGCAIFTLSHALQLLGLHTEESRPEALGAQYGAYLAEGGTVTENLLAAAGRAFGFSAGKEKMKSRDAITQGFEEGAVFSFSVADGHIALAAGLSDDGTKVRIIDSAPGATFERIENASLYYLDEQGDYQAAQTLMDIPGARFYLDTGEFGALTYDLDLDYVARRGVRMIKAK